MQIANARLVLTKVGSDVPVKDITPAEAMFLHILHSKNNGGKSFGEDFKKIEVVGEAMVQESPAVPEVKDKDGKVTTKATPAKTRPRTDAEELARLARKYGAARDKDNKPVINTIWPDRFNPKLPQTFAEIKWNEAAAVGVEVAPLNYVTGNVAKASL